MSDYRETFDRFLKLVRERPRGETMLSLIIDSPWLPGYAGVDTLDFYFDQTTWVAAYEQTLKDLPGVVFIPGAWAEFGMAAEPSGWGVPVHWSRTQPPGVGHSAAPLEDLASAPVPNPETDGLMPLLLKHYERVRAPMAERGLSPRIAAARGPLTVACHVHGVTELLLATHTEPEACEAFLDKTTELCIAWLEAQLRRMEEPVAVLLLDDVAGMLSPDDSERLVLPRFKRIFDRFEGLIRIFHNDTPNGTVFPGLATVGFDVFNLSHQIDLPRARKLLGPDIILMGNVPPLDVLVRGTAEQVREATKSILEGLEETGPVLVSPGGGVSPGTPIENLKAMAETVESFSFK